MTVFRTNNPQEYAQVDGIVIDERAPDPSIRGVSTGVAILVGQFNKGEANRLIEPGSFDKIKDIFGTGTSGYRALLGKTFSRLKIVRVEASTAAVAASKVFGEITLTAKEAGPGGNSITVTIANGSTSGKLYTISQGDVTETYDNIALAGVEAAFSDSALVDAVVADASGSEPTNTTGAENLTGGADETVDDADYEDAIAAASAEGAGNILFCDFYSETINGYLKAHAAETQDKIVICGGSENQTVAEAIAAADDLRDNDGRIIYAYNWLETTQDGAKVFVSPASYVASILSNTSAHIDPSFVDNSTFLYSVSDIKNQLTRSQFIQLLEGGVMAFQNDPDTGFGIKSGIVTQVRDSSKVTVIRRRMADWITNSIGRFLKNYQGAPNTQTNRVSVKNAILNWINTQETLGILPSDSEVQDGRAKIVDVVSRNSDESIAEGKFIIDYRQRIYSSMRFIILIAEIGQSVTVTEEGN